MGYWIKPGFVPESIDVGDLALPRTEISHDVADAAAQALSAGLIRQAGPIRAVVEIGTTLTDEDSIVMGFEPTSHAVPPTADDSHVAATERTTVDPSLGRAMRRRARRKRASLQLQAIPAVPLVATPAPPSPRTLLPPTSVAVWEQTGEPAQSLVTADLELELDMIVRPINEPDPAPLQLSHPARRPRRGPRISAVHWVVGFAIAIAAGMGLLTGLLLAVYFRIP